MGVKEEKQDFSKRLRESLRRARASSGAAGVAREFNLRYEGTPVTAQAVRKWLAGEALPSQDKLRALARWLDVSPHWLRFGDSDAAASETPALRQPAAAYRVDAAWLVKKYEALTDAHKKTVVEILIALSRLEGRR